MFATLFTAGLFAVVAPVPPSDGKGKPVEYTVHTGHFEKNTAGLKGEASYLALTDRAAFEKVFGAAFTSGRKPNVIPADAFEKKLVAAVVKRGNAPWTYKVEGVTLDGGTLTVKYTATPGQAGTATFASPLIVSADRAGVKKVEFVENGKPAGTTEVK